MITFPMPHPHGWVALVGAFAVWFVLDLFLPIWVQLVLWIPVTIAIVMVMDWVMPSEETEEFEEQWTEDLLP